MSGCCGRPKTTGVSHNRKANTYVTSSRSDPIQSPPNKKVNTLESYFVSKYKSSTTESQPLSPVESNQSSVTSAQTEEVPSASQSLSPSPIQLDECSANTIPTEDVLSAPTSPTPEIESEKASDSESEGELPTETASTLKPTDRQDGRKLACTLKWEKAYSWAHYSSIKGGWFCKICEEYSQTGDKFWKTVPKKHDAHPGEAFKEHSSSKKHTDAICSKKEIQSILSKGNIITQLQRGQEICSETDRKKNRDLIKKLIKKRLLSS